MDVGSTLRAARERRGKTLVQLASTTKIPVAILQAIEENDFDRVPRGIFARGFLRAYAAEVGLDPADLVAQFLRESGDVPPAAEPAPVDAPVEDDDGIEPYAVDGDIRPATPGWSYLAMIAALIVAFVAVNRYNEESPGGAAPAAAAAGADAIVDDLAGGDSSGAAQAVATAGRTASAEEPAGAAPRQTSTLQFVLQADEECWIEAVVDGRRAIYRLMQPGERATIESDDEIVLRVGDPGAVTYSVNGRPGEPLGRAGTPVTVRFTNQGA